jgi:hypothetical protein
MPINPLGGIGPAGLSGAGGLPKAGDSFGSLLKGNAQQPRLETSPLMPESTATGTPRTTAAVGAPPCQAITSTVVTQSPSSQLATRMVEQVSQAQSRMDHILKLAESGRSFSPAELLSLQAHVYRASQELDLAGKVVEKATNGVKQILQTQV